MADRESIALETRLYQALLLFGIVLTVGVGGYQLIEGWDLLDSVFMTIITLTTVGYGETHPLSPGGRIFTLFLLSIGMGTAAYTATIATQLLIETRLRYVLGRVRMDNQIKKLKNHIIVCGYGRVGRRICCEFKNRGITFVVIERDPVAAGIPPDVLAVAGNATEDATLQAARIETARSLVSALSSEADNVYVTLSARQLNPRLFITARADTEGMESKLRRAGADRIVCPYRTGAIRMAITTLQPHVVDFMDIVEGDDSSGLRLDEVEIPAGSPLVGQSLGDTEFRKRYGLTVVGIKRRDTPDIFNPSPQVEIREGDVLLVMGPPDTLARLVDQITEPQSRPG